MINFIIYVNIDDMLVGQEGEQLEVLSVKDAEDGLRETIKKGEIGSAELFAYGDYLRKERLRHRKEIIVGELHKPNLILKAEFEFGQVQCATEIALHNQAMHDRGLGMPGYKGALDEIKAQIEEVNQAMIRENYQSVDPRDPYRAAEFMLDEHVRSLSESNGES